MPGGTLPPGSARRKNPHSQPAFSVLIPLTRQRCVSAFDMTRECIYLDARVFQTNETAWQETNAIIKYPSLSIPFPLSSSSARYHSFGPCSFCAHPYPVLLPIIILPRDDRDDRRDGPILVCRGARRAIRVYLPLSVGLRSSCRVVRNFGVDVKRMG